MALVFPNEDTLHVALTSGLAPSSLSLSPTQYARRADGSIVLAPAMAVPDSVALALRIFGVTFGDEPSDGRPLAHWMEALPLAPVLKEPPITDQTPVLLELPTSMAADLV